MTTEDRTMAVVKHHLDAFLAADFQELFADYTDESVVMMPTGTVSGLQQFQEAMTQLAGLFTPENLSQVKIRYQDIQGEVAYVAWSMGTAVPFGCDTLIVRNGKIAYQTVGMHIPQ